MNLLHTFATNVKKYRLNQKLSQEKLGEIAGMHRTYISAIERERRSIAIDNIQKLADALNIEAYKLFIEEK